MENLAQFGTSFQLKAITLLAKNTDFLEQVIDILNPEYFESEANRWIIKTILKHYSAYGTIPTFDVFKVELEQDKFVSDVLRVSIIENLRQMTTIWNSPDLDYVRDQFLEFVKNQEMRNAIMESVDLLNVKDYENIRKRIDTALKAGAERDYGVIYKEEKYFERRVSDTVRDVVETPWDVINEIMGGGLGKGELGVVVAPAGIGKTWLLVCIGAHAAKLGLNVLHYTLELSDDYIALRYDARYSGINSQEIQFHQDAVKHELGKLKGNPIIKYYPTKTATIETLHAHINRLTTTYSFHPDLVILDYADLIRGHMKYADKRFELENIYEDLRGFGGEYGFPVWTASQSNRSSTEDEFIEANKISESYAKVMIADFVMSFQRRTKDKQLQIGRAHVIKNRFGQDGMTFPSKLNTANGNIQLFDKESKEGKDAEQQASDIEAIRSKLDEIKGASGEKKNTGLG